MQNQIPRNPPAPTRLRAKRGQGLRRAGWQKVKLGEVLKVRRGASPRPIHEYISSAGMPWLKIADITSSNSRYVDSTKEFIKQEGVSKSVLVRSGDLILSNSATPGIPRFMRITACVHDGWLILEPINKSISKDYLYYRLIIDRKKLVSNVTGAVFDNLKTDVLREHDVLLPSIDEQQKIASTLSAFDNKIEVNNKIAKTLEEMAQALFKEWFVNFKFPGHEKAEFVDLPAEASAQAGSELGKIPKGWSVGTLGELMEVKHGFAFPSEKFKTEGDIPVIKIKNIQEDKSVNLEGVDFVKLKDFTISLDNFKLSNGDILVALTGATTGKIGILIGSYDYYFLNQRVGKFAFHKPYNKWFSYIFLTRPSYRNLLLTSSDGSAQGNLSPGQIKSINLVIPNKDVLEKFNNLVESFYTEIIKNKSENQKLAALRDLLLPKLMSGELRI